MRDVAETRDQINNASATLQEVGAPVHQSVAAAFDLLKELAEADALRVPPDPPAHARWSSLMRALQTTRVAVLAAETQGTAGPRIAAQLAQAEAAVDEALIAFLHEYKSDVEDKIGLGDVRGAMLHAIDRAMESVAARRLISEARGARDEVNRVLGETRRAAGVVGETRLAKHFADYARRERRTANLFRVASIVVVLVITAVAGVLLFEGDSDKLTTTEELARLAVALPLAALAAYFGRESGRHRAASKWADELEIQLLTFDAFCEPLTDEALTQLRSDFGRRVFLSNGLGANGTSPDGPSTTSAATDLMEQAISLLRAGSR